MALNQNEREITPINLWMNGISSVANMLTLNGYSGYNFIDNPGEVQYSLSTYDAVEDSRVQILQGIVKLDYAVVADWGADDQPIFEYVAQQLNLTLI